MEKYIQFVANYDEWVAVKKLKIEEKTDPRTVMGFLAGLEIGIDGKIESNLGKALKLEKLDAVLDSINTGKTEQEIASALKELNSRPVSQAISEITSLQELQAGEVKELQGFCKVYAAKKILKKCGVNVDYSGIEIPGMKKIMKKKPQ